MPLKVSRILLDQYGVRSFYTNDWPRGLKATYTVDGTTWHEAAVTQAAPLTPATVSPDPPTVVRAVHLELTAAHDPEWWSIHELYVFAPSG